MQIQDLFTYILSEIPGCPDSQVIQAIRASAIELCVETHCWSDVLDPIPLQDGVSEYDVDAPNGARVVTVREVWTANQQLQPVDMIALQERVPNWQSATSSIPTYYNTTSEPSVLRVYPIPNSDAAAYLTIRAAFAPTLAATTLPDSMLNKYLETVVAGALSRLMFAPSKSWSNPQLAAYYSGEFSKGVVRAKTDTIHEKTQGSLTVKPIRFGYF